MSKTIYSSGSFDCASQIARSATLNNCFSLVQWVRFPELQFLPRAGAKSKSLAAGEIEWSKTENFEMTPFLKFSKLSECFFFKAFKKHWAFRFSEQFYNFWVGNLSPKFMVLWNSPISRIPSRECPIHVVRIPPYPGWDGWPWQAMGGYVTGESL